MKSDAYIFGCGAGGLNCLIFFSRKYNIKGFIDNDDNIQARFGKLPKIYHPSELKGLELYNKTVIVSSLEIFIIVDQLLLVTELPQLKFCYPSLPVIYSPIGKLLKALLITRNRRN